MATPCSIVYMFIESTTSFIWKTFLDLSEGRGVQKVWYFKSDRIAKLLYGTHVRTYVHTSYSTD